MGKQQTIRMKPSQLIAGRIYIKKGVRYSFDDRPFMRAIFNDSSRYKLMKTARQISKSTTLAGAALCKMEAHAPYTVLFTAPEMDQTKKFSYDRVQPTVDSSPDIKALVSKDDIKNVYEKSFSNGSKYYLKYAKTAADSCRGISCDEWHCDEVQDVILKNVEPVIQESMFASRYGYRMYSGTPKSFENGIEQLWKKSDQREWMVRCWHHGELPYHQRMTLKNVGKEGQICDRCGNLLNVRDGVWVRHRTKTDQGEPVHISGYHVAQIMLPTTKEGGVLKWFDFLLELKNADSENWVLNEKFGESADSSEKPITEDELKAICQNRPMATEPEEWMKRRTWWAGIDWGLGLGSSTVLVIGCTGGPENKFEYVRIRRWVGDDCDPKIVIPAISYELKRFRIKHVHCDFGGAVDMNVRLQEEGFSVSTNYWSANATKVNEQDVFGIMRYTLNRSIEMSDFFADIKKHRVSINMAWTDFQPFSTDLLCIFKEERKTKQEHQLPFFDHPNGTMDDACHAMIYARLAADISNENIVGRRRHDPFARQGTKNHNSVVARDPFA